MSSWREATPVGVGIWVTSLRTTGHWNSATLSEQIRRPFRQSGFLRCAGQYSRVPSIRAPPSAERPLHEDAPVRIMGVRGENQHVTMLCNCRRDTAETRFGATNRHHRCPASAFALDSPLGCFPTNTYSGTGGWALFLSRILLF